MDSDLKKYVTMQSQLEKQIKELFAERKMLQNRINVLNECLSYKKIKQKILELENKQNLLKSLEIKVNLMRTEIKPLDYLKQLLQKQLIVSSVSTSNNDLNIEKQKCSVSSQLLTSSECAIETLDSLSDVDSEGSVMVLSEYDIVSDDEVFESTEQTMTNKVMYNEALQMASSVHSLHVDSPTSNTESVRPSQNVSEQKDDVNCCLESDTKDSIAFMDSSIKIKQLLEMYDVKKKDLISSTENAKMKLGNDKEKIESIIHDVCSLSFSDETLGDVGINPSDNIKHDNMPKLLNDSWVKVDTNEVLDTSMKSEQLNDISQKTGSQKDNTISIENLDVQIQMQTDELCNHQLNSRGNSEITNLENNFCVNDGVSFKNEVCNLVCLTNDSRNKGVIESSLLNMKCSSEPRDCNKPKVDPEVENCIENDLLCSHSTELKNNNEVQHIHNANSHNFNFENEIHNPVCLDKVLKYKTEIDSSLLTIKHECNELKVNSKVENNKQNDQLCSYSSELKKNSQVKNFQNACKFNLKNEILNSVFLNKVETDSPFLSLKRKLNEPKVNTEVKIHELNDQLCSDFTDFKEKYELKNLNSAVRYNVNNNILKNEVYNPVYLANSLKNENVIQSSLINNKCFSLLKGCNEPKINIKVEMNDMINNLSSSHQPDSYEMPMQLCPSNEFDALGLNFKLLNGIHKYGFQHLMTLQQQCISHCINGCDVVLHSYPCAGKSTMCFISVLQRINTSINECQAIILVPTLELALFTQRVINSLGIFMNVFTCIGGTNVPRKVSPVPHVIISTPQGLCDMINCNSLSKDFVKMLVIDDAEVMIKSVGFFNKIRHILLFLKNDRQLIILSTSNLEEILDHFSDKMQNPEYIILPDEKPSLDDVIQYYLNVPEELKFDVLLEMYLILNLKRTIVYCNSWNKSFKIAEDLRLKTCAVSAVHNEMDTSQRNLILHQFRTDIFRMLVTTELLKGEDFSDVIYVINYNFPKCPKNYVRRILSCHSRHVRVFNFLTPNDQTSKENIEATFNMHMLYFPQDLNDFDLKYI